MVTTKTRKIFAVETEESVGAKVRRLFPTRFLPYIDPFVLLDEFFLDPVVGFPDHPHRGFEAITYMLEGSFLHQDNLGNRSEILPGGILHFSAGKGLVHSEMPGKQSLNHGLQLWINLPKNLKKLEPAYQKFDPDEIPETSENGIKIRTIAGRGSPVKLYTPVLYQVILMEKTSISLPTPPGYSGFIYVFQGKLATEVRVINPGEGLLLSIGEKVSVQASEMAGFILAVGQPHGEPIHLNGPFVD